MSEGFTVNVCIFRSNSTYTEFNSLIIVTAMFIPFRYRISHELFANRRIRFSIFDSDTSFVMR